MDAKATGEKVHIQLHSSIQHPDQEKETHNIRAIGRYTEKNGAAYLQYEEEQEGQKIQTIVKLGDKEALIMRSGAVKMRLPFSLDEDRLGEYRNEQVVFKLQVITNGLNFSQNKDRSGNFSVVYELHAEGSLLGKYELSITYSEGIK